jgi:hypothetical protein
MRICCLIRSMPVYLLGHRVLDLDAGVDLEDVKVLVLVDEELDRARVRVPRGLQRGARRCRSSFRAPTASARATGDSSTSFWWRRCIEQSRSQEVHGVAVVVGEDLHLDVPAELDVLLDVDRRVLERVLASACACLKPARRRRRCAPRASRARHHRGSLDDDRVADFLRDAQGDLLVIDGAVGAGDGRHLRALRELLALDLVADGAIALTGGPMNSMRQERQISAKWSFSARKP